MKFCVKVFITACLLIQMTGVLAARQHRSTVNEKRLVKFDWNCAVPAAYPAKLKRPVKTTMRRNNSWGVIWGDRAFAFDLNADQTPEYFVPINCGGTGNCDWGVYSTNPVREMGFISGETIYVHKRPDGYPSIVTYTHMSAAEGVWSTYRFQGRNYRWLGDAHKTDATGIFASKLPRRLEQARSSCVATSNQEQNQKKP